MHCSICMSLFNTPARTRTIKKGKGCRIYLTTSQRTMSDQSIQYSRWWGRLVSEGDVWYEFKPLQDQTLGSWNLQHTYHACHAHKHESYDASLAWRRRRRHVWHPWSLFFCGASVDSRYAFFHIFPSFFITCSPLPHLYSDKFYLCLPSCGFFYFLPLFFSLQYYYCYYYYYSVTCRSFVFFSTDDRRTDPLQMLSRKLLDSFLCFGNKTQGNEHEGSSSFVGPSFLLFLLLLLLFCAAVGSRV